jgi:hypothetical protein
VSTGEVLATRPRVTAVFRAKIAPLAAGVTAALLGSLFLARKSIWVDESFSHQWAAKSLRAQIEGDHWLYYATLKAWTMLAGDSELAMRLPSVVAAALAAAALVVLGRRLLDPLTGAVAGLLLAANPFVVTWSQQARGYTILVLLAVLATIALDRALERSTWPRWLLYAALLALTMVWQVFGALLVPVHLLAVALRLPRPPLRYPFVAFAVAIAAFSPWLYAVATRGENNGETTWRTTPDFGDIAIAIVRLSGPAVVGLVLASFGTVILIRNRDHRRTGIFIAFWVLIPIALVLIGLLAKPVFVDRYVIITAPAFALLQAAALAQLRYPPALAIAAVAVAVPTITALAFWYHGRGVEDWRGAVALTAAEPADQVVVTPFWAMPAYEYYARGTAALQPSERDLWVISEGFSTSHAVQSARAAIGSRPYVLVDDRAFGDHLRVQRWRRR